MSLFSHDHNMPSWAEIITMLGLAVLGLVTEVVLLVRHLRNRTAP